MSRPQRVYFSDDTVTLHHGDALDVLSTLDAGSVDCAVTSPPYFCLRDYGQPGQYGLEASPAEYVETMRGLFAEVRRVLADDGTLWLNIGDSYVSGGAIGRNDAGRDFTVGGGNKLGSGNPGRQGTRKVVNTLPAKNLLGIPWRVAFALQDDGWILRNAIVWHKPNAMPTSVTDRLGTKHEHVFLFAKSPRYWFDLDAIREAPRSTADEYARAGASVRANHELGSVNGSKIGARSFMGGLNPLGVNPGDVWAIPPTPFPGAHFATMPVTLAERCIQAGCKPSGTVLDPFSGSGTTGLAAARHGRRYVGIDLSAEYLDLSLRTRLAQAGMFGGVA